jgi:hypothetical protein
MVDRLLAFIHSPSRNHLILSNGCLDGLKYTDVGFEVSCFIADIIGDRHLSMRTQDYINKLFREHIFLSDYLGRYLAVTNVGILFEPLLKLDVETLLNRWSQNNTLLLDVGNGILNKNIYYLSKDCKDAFSVPLESINYLVHT